jgi:2'-hydroxyisoflavone reductase
MNILVLGGSGFLGPDIVEPLVKQGHTVTLFNRGKTRPGLFPELEKLVGDRNNDLKALEGRAWDVVVDVPATLPLWVKMSTALLVKNCKRYVFVSSVSVYDDFSSKGMDEAGQTFDVDPALDQATKPSNELFGPMKRRCEAIVQEMFNEHATIVRPGLIVGPDDPTDRFTYWPARIDRGGEVLAPMPQDMPVQFIDSRDLGAFIAKLIDDGHTGTYNATGPGSLLTMDQMLYGIRAATSSPVSFTWVDTAFLLGRAGPFMEVPLWVPGEEMKGFMSLDCSKAVSHGLSFRPLADTARDIMAWVKTLPPDRKWVAGLKPEKEQQIMADWKKR